MFYGDSDCIENAQCFSEKILFPIWELSKGMCMHSPLIYLSALDTAGHQWSKNFFPWRTYGLVSVMGEHMHIKTQKSKR